MKLRLKIPFLVALIVALCAASQAAAAEGSRTVPKPSKADVATAGDLQKLIGEFNAKRDSILADREALMNQLKNATDEQKKAILEKMQAQQKDLLDAQRALQKQIRDEMRRLRQASPANGRH